MDVNDLRKILENLAKAFSGVYPVGFKGVFGVNYGLHFTGGEPFLKFNLLLKAVELAEKLGIPGKFVETNCFWCVNEEVTRSKFEKLREAGLDGVLISANPFVIEHVPFERIKRAVKVAEEIFGRRNVMIYHPLFYEPFFF